MAAFKSSVTIPPYPQGEFNPPSGQGALSLVSKRERQGAVMSPPKGFYRRFGTFFREYRRSMRVINAAFAHTQSSDGAGPRARSEERLRDEEAWSRIDDEGCPRDGRLQPDPRQDIIREFEGSPRM